MTIWGNCAVTNFVNKYKRQNCITATTKKSRIHIHEDANLVEVLSKVPLGSDIPVELYQTVAEVLAFVYRVDQRYKENYDSKNLSR